MIAPKAIRSALADLDMIRTRDPSILSRTEALLHPAVLVIWSYRIAHRLHGHGLRRTARLISALARVASGGIEIHPGARIGRGFFIDHGAGVVIGETAVIGDDVTLFHQVTLGSIGWWHDATRPEGARRHPQVGDRVTIGANATLLGPISIGSDSVIGAQALVMKNIPSGSRVLAPIAATRVVRRPRVSHPLAPQYRLPAAPAPAGARRQERTPAGFPAW
jgi:serine O-acetyltransferase